MKGMITSMASPRKNNGKNASGRFTNKSSRASKDWESKKKFDNDKMCANDPSWYIREGQLAKDVASISFNTAIGVNSSLDPNDASTSAGLIGCKFSAPGIMAIHTLPAPGYSVSPVSPINIAAKNLYSFVRHANSGHSNYDSPDLIMYYLAMDSVFDLIYAAQRVLGVAQLFSQKNRYIGDYLIQALGIEPNNLRANIAQYRARLNMNIVKASVFAIPNTFTLFKRHAWMYSNIFADSPVDKCQLYAYLPSIVYKYNETSGGPGQLDPMPIFLTKSASAETFNNNIVPLSYLLTQMETLLSTLQASEDINIMSGDILKAYGRENLFTLSLIPENFSMAPIYSDEILDQIHNTRFAGNKPRKDSTLVTDFNTYSLDSLVIRQDPSIGAGNIIFTPCFADIMTLSYDAVIDMVDNEPTPERVLVATRNTIAGTTTQIMSGDHPAGWLTRLDSFASDICLCAYIYFTAADGLLSYSTVYHSSSIALNTDTTKRLLMFRKAPMLWSTAIDAAAGTATLTLPYSSMENYTVVNDDTLSKMHQSAILSMLGVPV